jgi:hypothetical protein
MGLVVKDDGWRIPDEGVRDLARRHHRRAANTDGIAVGLNVADLFIPSGRAMVPRPGAGQGAEPADPRRVDSHGTYAANSAPYLGRMRPFALDSADQFQPAGRQALSSKRCVDYNEVNEIGSSTSTTRTAEQTVAARFGAEALAQQARRAPSASSSSATSSTWWGPRASWR